MVSDERTPPTKADIGAAMRLLLDERIPWEHAPDQPNCGECWSCIFCTLGIAHTLRQERRAAHSGRFEVPDVG